MTITMSLELEKGAKLDDVAKVLSRIGECFSYEGEELWGDFNRSGSHFVFRYADEFDEIVAEGFQLAWKVGIRGAIHCRANALDYSQSDIEGFLTKLSEETGFGFILSFQYESVYVVRDKSGLRFLKKMVG
ncbi:hypothetical protein [Pseudomonas citronellolis]|uniref:hypothetical protein n=1 Tax=Pseudomonas citronellolis TaxID=53408 RepID=UPI0023E409DE|nr:hypothetical protein [Pseudomonas citronellolis]MDF3931351.1 hypothetical protein [Pseudomonas citronellolis]